MLRRNKKEENTQVSEKSAAQEFNERVSRLLLVCIAGLCKLIPEQESLNTTLRQLEDVVKKAIRSKPVTGIAKDIEDFFNQWILENEFRGTKDEAMKQIVLDLSSAIQQMVSTSGSFDQNMGKYVEKIQAAGKIDDILSLKDGIIKEIQQVQATSQTMRKELEEYRSTTQSLASKLEQTEAKALVDSLTKVLNRNAYNMKIAQMIREYHRAGGKSILTRKTFCLFVVDIDHFKKFNDQYGHKAGDRVLRSVASTIQETLRATDLVFRYGGEEFVILLAQCTLDNALSLANKIRSQVEKEYFVDQDKKMKITISVGVAAAQENDTEVTLFERADQAMYSAKRKGRNRVEIGK
ncbi:MAG: GGDEF domain-containing protein [Nitrospinaceae bacterium]